MKIKKDKPKYIFYTGLILISVFALRCKSEKNIPAILQNSIVPLDTVELEGYLFTGYKDYQAITLYTKKKTIIRNFSKAVEKKKAYVYILPIGFHGFQKGPTFEKSFTKDSLITLESVDKGRYYIRKVRGKFIIGISSSDWINGIASENYYLKENILTIVITPL